MPAKTTADDQWKTAEAYAEAVLLFVPDATDNLPDHKEAGLLAYDFQDQIPPIPEKYFSCLL